MFEELNIRVVEDFLQERVTSFHRLATANGYCAFLLSTEHEKYLLKGNLNKSVKSDYLNHKTVYNLYKESSEKLPFSVAKPYFYSKQCNFYLTQYISGGVSLGDVVATHPLIALNKTFFKVGEVLFAYHQLVSKNQESAVFYFDKGKSERLKNTHCFSPGEFSLENLVIDDNRELWIEDFSNFSISFAPRIKDISFFIKNSEQLIFNQRFLSSLFAKKRVAQLMSSFCRGYGEDFTAETQEIIKKSDEKQTLVASGSFDSCKI